jgi:hypothetical protein
MSMMQMAVSGYLDPAISLLKKTDGAHLYRPGVGWLDNLRAGNYIDSVGALPVVLDSPVGLTLDALSVLGSDQISNPDTGAMTPGGSTPPTFAATEYLGLPCRAITFNLSGSTSYASANAVAPTEGVFIAIGKTLEYSYELSLSRLLVGAENIQLYDQSTAVYTSNIDAGASNSAIGVWKKINQIEKTKADTPVRSTIAVYCQGNFTGGPLTAYIRAISVREITGIHASQNTTADKPKLTRRVNQWIGTNNGSALNGTGTAVSKFGSYSRITPTGDTNDIHYFNSPYYNYIIGQRYSVFLEAKSEGLTYINWHNYANTKGTVSFNVVTGTYVIQSSPGQVNVAASISLLEDGWSAIKIEFTMPSGSDMSQYWSPSPSASLGYLRENGKTMLVRNACLTTAENAHLPYQKVNTATDYATAGFPDRWDFDATDRLQLTLPAGYENATIIDATSAGPVTLLEQDVTGTYGIVGGLTDGGELASDPSFDDAGKWTAASGITVSGGVAVYDNAAHGNNLTDFSFAFVNGKTYLISITATSYTSGSITVYLKNAGGNKIVSGVGTYQTKITATENQTGLTFQADGVTLGACVMTLGKCSVKEILPSTHGRIILRDTPTPRQLELCQGLASRLAGL